MKSWRDAQDDQRRAAIAAAGVRSACDSRLISAVTHWPAITGATAEELPHALLRRVPPDRHAHALDHPDLPPEVLAIQLHARTLGRDHVLFDADQVGDLPTCDW